MSKTELVNKIINRAGVPEADVKILLEVLLNKLAESLKTGDSAEIEGIGTFHFIKGELQKSENAEDSDKETVIDLIAFSPSKNFDPDSDDNLIFNVPDPALGNYSAVDSFFTLSAGKPIIPLDQNPNADLFVPRSEIEKWSLIETKAEKLLTEVTIWKDNIEPGKFIKLKEGEFNENNLKNDRHEGKVKKDDVDLDNILMNNSDDDFNDENVSWEFGNENSKQFRESFSKDENKSTDKNKPIDETNKINENQHERTSKQNEEINWNFGGSKFRDKLKKENIDLTQDNDFETEDGNDKDLNKKDKPKSKDEIENKQDFFELNQFKTENEPENSLDIDLSEEDFEIPKYEVQEDEKIGSFQRVKSLNSEFGNKDIEKNVINKIAWESNENDQKYSEDSPKNTKHEFVRVQSKTTEFGYDLEDLKSLNENKFKKAESPELSDDSKEEINIDQPYITGNVGKQEKDEIPEFEKNIEEETRIEPVELDNNLEEEKKMKPIQLDDDFEEEKNIELSGERTKQMQDLEDKDEAIKEAFDFVTKKRELIDEYSEPKRKKGAVIAASIFGIIIIAVAVIMIFGPHTVQTEGVRQVKKGNGNSFENVISRNYDIPVEYPYSPNESSLHSSFDVISPSVFRPQIKTPDSRKSNVQTSSTPKKEIGKKVDKPKEVVTQKSTVTNKSSDISKSVGVKVEQYISKYGDNYAVQVSSWPTRTKAGEQVQLYNRRGYHSFIEEANIPGRGTWYRVKVGDFKTLDQARKFFNGNK